MERVLEIHSAIGFDSHFMALPGTGRHTFQVDKSTIGPGSCRGSFLVLRLLIIGLAGEDAHFAEGDREGMVRRIGRAWYGAVLSITI